MYVRHLALTDNREIARGFLQADARLVDQEGLNPTGICAETAGRMEDLGLIEPGDREKLLVLLIDYAPAAEYGRLLENIG